MIIDTLTPVELAGMVADRMRRTRDSGDRPPTATEVVHSVRRLLEEGGVHCATSPGLQDLKGYVISSAHGAEITVSDRLQDGERLDLYAQLLAHAMVGTVDARPRTVFEPLWSAAFGTRVPNGPAVRRFFAHLEYVDGREPEGPTDQERRASALARVLAEAILGGHVDLAPRYAFGPGAVHAKWRGLRPALGRLLLDLCHRTSLALFWRSTRYRRLRANRQVTGLTHHVEWFVRRAYAIGAA